MFRNVLHRAVTETVCVHRYVKHASLNPASVSVRSFTGAKDEAQPPFDTSLLEFLVCPLSKKPLR